MRNFLILFVTLGFAATACAQSTSSTAAPDVPTDPPYIVLSANHDEPNGYGFCIDTYGRGQSDLLQTHSCKPAKAGEERSYSGNDTRFEYNADTQQIMSYPFEGYCMQALVATGLTVFALLECSDHPRQKFVHNADDESLRLAEDQSRCITVVSETVPAGPWVKRPLNLETCDDAETSLKRWTIVAK